MVSLLILAVEIWLAVMAVTLVLGALWWIIALPLRMLLWGVGRFEDLFRRPHKPPMMPPPYVVPLPVGPPPIEPRAWIVTHRT